jgi:hypothetical protein
MSDTARLLLLAFLFGLLASASLLATLSLCVPPR